MDEIPSDTDEETKIHRTVSDNSTEIAGRIQGKEPFWFSFRALWGANSSETHCYQSPQGRE